MFVVVSVFTVVMFFMVRSRVISMSILLTMEMLLVSVSIFFVMMVLVIMAMLMTVGQKHIKILRINTKLVRSLMHQLILTQV